MAPRLSTAAKVVGLGSLALMALSLPPEPQAVRTQTTRTPAQGRLTAVRRTLMRSNEGLLLLQRRDSLLAVLPDRPDGAPAVAFGSRVGEEWRRWVDEHVTALWQSVEPVDASVAIGVLAVIDTALPPGGYARLKRTWSTWMAHVLPSDTGRASCLSVVSLGGALVGWGTPETFARRRRGRYQAPDFLGPCAYYAAFGLPGPAIGEWIENGAWHLGRRWAGLPESLAGLWRGMRLRESDDRWAFRGCLLGRVVACRELALSPRLLTRTETIGLEAVALSRRGPWPVWQDSFFALLVREYGRDRFQQFWASALPVDSAFADAFGAGLGPWTRDWLWRFLGEPRPEERTGGAAFAMSLLFAVGLTALGVARAQRRSVT